MSEPIQVGDRFEYIDEVEGAGWKGTVVEVLSVDSNGTVFMTFKRAGGNGGNGGIRYSRQYIARHLRRLPREVEPAKPEPGSREIIPVGSHWIDKTSKKSLTVTAIYTHDGEIGFVYGALPDVPHSVPTETFLRRMARVGFKAKPAASAPPPEAPPHVVDAMVKATAPTCDGCGGPLAPGAAWCTPCLWVLHVANEELIATRMAKHDEMWTPLHRARRDRVVSSFIAESYEPSPAGLGAIACRLTGTAGRRVR